MLIRTETVEIPSTVEMEYAVCEDCKCDLEDTMEVLTSQPPQYKYVCPQCGRVYTSFKWYANHSKE